MPRRSKEAGLGKWSFSEKTSTAPKESPTSQPAHGDNADARAPSFTDAAPSPRKRKFKADPKTKNILAPTINYFDVDDDNENDDNNIQFLSVQRSSQHFGPLDEVYATPAAPQNKQTLDQTLMLLGHAHPSVKKLLSIKAITRLGAYRAEVRENLILRKLYTPDTIAKDRYVERAQQLLLGLSQFEANYVHWCENRRTNQPAELNFTAWLDGLPEPLESDDAQDQAGYADLHQQLNSLALYWQDQFKHNSQLQQNFYANEFILSATRAILDQLAAQNSRLTTAEHRSGGALHEHLAHAYGATFFHKPIEPYYSTGLKELADHLSDTSIPSVNLTEYADNSLVELRKILFSYSTIRYELDDNANLGKYIAENATQLTQTRCRDWRLFLKFAYNAPTKTTDDNAADLYYSLRHAAPAIDESWPYAFYRVGKKIQADTVRSITDVGRFIKDFVTRDSWHGLHADARYVFENLDNTAAKKQQYIERILETNNTVAAINSNIFTILINFADHLAERFVRNYDARPMVWTAATLGYACFSVAAVASIVPNVHSFLHQFGYAEDIIDKMVELSGVIAKACSTGVVPEAISSGMTAMLIIGATGEFFDKGAQSEPIMILREAKYYIPRISFAIAAAITFGYGLSFAHIPGFSQEIKNTTGEVAFINLSAVGAKTGLMVKECISNNIFANILRVSWQIIESTLRIITALLYSAGLALTYPCHRKPDRIQASLEVAMLHYLTLLDLNIRLGLSIINFAAELLRLFCLAIRSVIKAAYKTIYTVITWALWLLPGKVLRTVDHYEGQMLNVFGTIFMQLLMPVRFINHCYMQFCTQNSFYFGKNYYVNISITPDEHAALLKKRIAVTVTSLLGMVAGVAIASTSGLALLGIILAAAAGQQVGAAVGYGANKIPLGTLKTALYPHAPTKIDFRRHRNWERWHDAAQARKATTRLAHYPA